MKKLFFIGLMIYSATTIAQVVNDNENDFPTEGSIPESSWGNYLLGENSSNRTIRLGVANDFYTRAEIELENNNTSSGKIFFKTTNNSGGAISRMVINDIGNVGIGTLNPGVYNSNPLYQIYNLENTVFDVQGGSNSGWISVGSNIDNNILGGLAFTKPNGQSDAHRQIAYIRVRTSLSSYNTPNSTLEFATKGAGSLGDPDMVLTSSGSLGIGTETTGNHKLAVEGTIGAREIVVESGIWSDFVFEPNYNLPTLQEVETYINQNGHLPDIPSAEEVEENGISLGEMDAKLLQKIEELTLYVLKQQNEIDKLKEVIKTVRDDKNNSNAK